MESCLYFNCLPCPDNFCAVLAVCSGGCSVWRLCCAWAHDPMLAGRGACCCPALLRFLLSDCFEFSASSSGFGFLQVDGASCFYSECLFGVRLCLQCSALVVNATMLWFPVRCAFAHPFCELLCLFALMCTRASRCWPLMSGWLCVGCACCD